MLGPHYFIKAQSKPKGINILHLIGVKLKVFKHAHTHTHKNTLKQAHTHTHTHTHIHTHTSSGSGRLQGTSHSRSGALLHYSNYRSRC